MCKNRKKIMAVLITALMFSLIACGKDAEEITVVDAETTEESSEEISEETVKETKPALPYVEENGLKFTNETKVQTQGTLCVGDDTDNADVIDVDWEIADISVSDAEDGIKTITIEQITYGYIWTDGDIFKTNLNLPSALLCDKNSGKIIPMTEERTTTEIEWEEEKFSIETIEAESWEDGDWSSEWVEDANGGERLASTLKVTDTIKVKDYDALALVLIPVTSADNSIVGNYIMDVWKDGSYLFSISDMSAEFEQIKDVQTAESEKETESIEASQPKETTAPKQEETKTAHTHSYNGVITIQPTCTISGIKTYTCSCGDSYTENLGTTAHNFTEPVYGTVHHDEVWQNVPREVTVKTLICGCGAKFTSNDEYQAHAVASVEAGDFRCGMRSQVEETTETVYDYVKVADAYDEQVIVSYKCSVCGQQQ